MIAGILLAAGSSVRMGFDKLFTPIAGKTALQRSADLLVLGGCEQLIVVTTAVHLESVRSLASAIPLSVVLGGQTRGESVLNGLLAAKGADIAVIHDAARCFTPVSCVKESIESALKHGSGVLALPIVDTIVRSTPDALETLNRADLWRTQTPQAFQYDAILSAYRSFQGNATDDATVFQKHIGKPRLVMGSGLARKLTTSEDWEWAKEQCMICTKFGIGYDVHRLVPERKLILGGVEIPHEKGLLGHSDADVLIHAIIDAILGAAALGDIGVLFPDSDMSYRGISSRELLRRTMGLVYKQDMTVVHVDATVVCQRPKLRGYIDAMRTNLAADLRIPVEDVSVKATTTEGMNDEGRELCISAQAIAQVTKNWRS